ncbi:MAG: hypothetical protein AB3N14_00990 [Flavobacteriaceae bacterium]
MRFALCFVILMVCFSCKEEQAAKEWSRAKVTDQVVQMLLDYHTAIAKDGLMAEFPYLDDSNDFFWVPPGYTAPLGIDSVKAILTQNAKGFAAINFEWESLEIFPLSEDIATYTGIVSGTMTDTADQVTHPRIIESGTLIKRNDGWKLLCGQSANLEEQP